MAGTILRDSIIIGCIGVGVALLAANREAVYAKFGYEMAASTPKPTVIETVGPTPKAKALSGVAVSIPKSKRDGQFWTEATVNGGFVKFLVDTGASSVALTPEDARRAGIRLDRLTYDIPIETAGGRNYAARVNLKQVSVGAVTIRDVEAFVVPEGLSTSLLGMSYLGELQRVEVTPDALILRL